MSPKVTVLMPVYNGAPFLQATIKSILAQTFSDFEFLIIDDGSTDATVTIIESFSDKRIRLLRNSERLRLSGALNRGLDEASGIYVARMDADDLAVPFRLEKQVHLLDNHPEVGLCGGWICKFGNVKKEICRFPESEEQFRVYTLFDCPCAHPTVMMRKELFDKHNLRYDGWYYPTEDYELWSRAIELFSCVNIPEVLLNYRVHDSSMTCSDWSEMDSKAAAIAGTQLSKMGLNLTDEEILFHRNICRGTSYRSSDIDGVLQGEKWLKYLLEKNRVKSRYNESVFLEAISLIWFRLCMAAAPLGFKVLRCYSQSTLHQKKNETKRLAVLALSIMKNRF